jgi:hypothetical protein
MRKTKTKGVKKRLCPKNETMKKKTKTKVIRLCPKVKAHTKNGDYNDAEKIA